MRKLISAKLAGNILLTGLLLLGLFHVLVLLEIAPSEIVWGGNTVGSDSNLLLMEMIALIITLLFILIVAVRLGYIPGVMLKNTVGIGMWIIFAFFILNTVGNLASNITAEKLIFAPVTLVFAFLALSLAVGRRGDSRGFMSDHAKCLKP